MKTHKRKTQVSLLNLAAGALLIGSVIGVSDDALAGVFGTVEPFQYAHGDREVPISLHADEYLPADDSGKRISLPKLNTPFVSASIAGYAGKGALPSHSFWNVTQGDFRQLSANQEQQRSTFEEVVLTVVGVGAYIAIQGANVWASKELDRAFGY